MPNLTWYCRGFLHTNKSEMIATMIARHEVKTTMKDMFDFLLFSKKSQTKMYIILLFFFFSFLNFDSNLKKAKIISYKNFWLIKFDRFKIFKSAGRPRFSNASSFEMDKGWIESYLHLKNGLPPAQKAGSSGIYF